MADPCLGLLLSRDLIFTSKVTDTARALGRRVVVASDRAQATTLIETRRPRIVFVDLAAGEVAGVPSLTALRALADPEATFLAFGSHVDTAALAAAKSAGCDPVLPRSRFSAELADLIQRHLEPVPDGTA
jgi:DNA-binding NarL/FixJ family response regulator